MGFFRLQNGDTVGVRAGCAVEPVTQATFSPASPGYVQLNHMDLNGRIDISFMFRTLQVLDSISFHLIFLDFGLDISNITIFK